MRTRQILYLPALLLLLVSESILAACEDPGYEPYRGRISLICRIDWQDTGLKENALFMPVDNQTWIAWIDSTAYDLLPVVMNVTTNSCSGLALVGRTSKRLYRVIIEADSQRIIANMETNESSQKDDGSGLCKVVDEDVYRIDLQRVNDDTT